MKRVQAEKGSGRPLDTEMTKKELSEESVEKTARKLIETTVKKAPVPVAEKGAYEIAKAGGRHAGLLRTYAEKSASEIKRALRSYENQVALHQEKLSNPAKFVKNWESMSEQAREGLLRHWKQDIIRNQELADIMRGILKERGL
jgi:hypothetical protein